MPGSLLSCLPEKTLDFDKVTYLVEVVIMILHALDRYIFASFDALRFQDLRKGALSLLAY